MKDGITQRQEELLFNLVEVYKSLPPKQQKEEFKILGGMNGRDYYVGWGGEEIEGIESDVLALVLYGYATGTRKNVPGVGARFCCRLTKEAFQRYDSAM